MTSLSAKLATVQQATSSALGLLFAPRVQQLPLPIQRYDDPFLPFGKAIINATRDLVCAYVFDLASYMALGAAGAVALERTISYAAGDAVTILHGPFAGAQYAVLTEETSFGVDAVTLVDSLYLDAYLRRPDRGAFIVRTGYARMVDTPGRGGVFWQDDFMFAVLGDGGEPLRIRLLGETVLYAGRGDDFAEQVRRAVEQQRV